MASSEEILECSLENPRDPLSTGWKACRASETGEIFYVGPLGPQRDMPSFLRGPPPLSLFQSVSTVSTRAEIAKVPLQVGALGALSVALVPVLASSIQAERAGEVIEDFLQLHEHLHLSQIFLMQLSHYCPFKIR
jgi:hypothetical protein